MPDTFCEFFIFFGCAKKSPNIAQFQSISNVAVSFFDRVRQIMPAVQGKEDPSLLSQSAV